MYFFQPFRCKKSNEITKSGSICLFQKLDSLGAPKPTLGPKTPVKYPRRAEIGINASHAVQLTSFGPKKTDSNRSPQRSVPFTWNHPVITTSMLFIVICPCNTCPWSKVSTAALQKLIFVNFAEQAAQLDHISCGSSMYVCVRQN